MNKTRWEYMRVTYVSSTKMSPTPQTWSEDYWVCRPGAEREHLAAASVDFDVLLNELGSEGWDLVSEHTRDSVVLSSQHGWPMVRVPVKMVWTFKRPCER